MLAAVIVPSGATAAFGVSTADPDEVQPPPARACEYSSKFVPAGSFKYPHGIPEYAFGSCTAAPANVVLKYWTPSTPAPYQGELSTPVLT